MVERLLFRLAGPMASFGDITVGEIRSSWAEPSKSAVLGLVAAALGVPRTEPARHAALHRAFSYAVRVDGRPQPLRDFHTSQVPSARKNRRYSTRSQELADPDGLNTILSQRWSWQGFAAVACLTPRGEEPGDPGAIRDALRRPAFPLFLGRKANPLGWPLQPEVIAADTLAEAFAAYDQTLPALERVGWAKPPAWPAPGVTIWTDLGEGLPVHGRRRRRDTVRDRRAWTFDEREEASLEFSAPATGGA